MTLSSSFKDKFYKKVINAYLLEVMNHPHAIKMREGVLHIWDVQGPKKEGSEKAMLAEVEEEKFKCQGMVDLGLNVNHSMILDFINEHKMDIKEIMEIIFNLHDKIQDLQA
ncbi:40s ribosomal protein s5-1 [Hordeum vulgare]|nr:40s ribosomal protein s5-1 [Hordeum vulgare]